jgi:hypothetical protein
LARIGALPDGHGQRHVTYNTAQGWALMRAQAEASSQTEQRQVEFFCKPFGPVIAENIVALLHHSHK